MQIEKVHEVVDGIPYMNLKQAQNDNRKLLDATNIENYEKLFSTIAHHIKINNNNHNKLNILEAGCGRRWSIDLNGVPYTLTGVDIDKKALEIRNNKTKDLDISILADLRNVSLDENYYDVVYSYNVLEHISGVEPLLLKFKKWLNKDGILILRFPNRNSTRGFVTRVTPFWFHVFFKKYIEGYKNAGKPGFDPYRTVFDKVVSRKGMHEFCKKHNLNIKAEYRIDFDRNTEKSLIGWLLKKTFFWFLHIISFRKLTVNHYGLLYIIEKSS